MLLIRRLCRFVRLGSRIAATALALSSAISVRAANVAPELSTPLPALDFPSGATSAPIALAGHFRDPDVPGSAVRVTTRIGTHARHMDLALFDAQTPRTVANFLAYVDAGRYAANFYHRSVPGFIIQTGGFYFVNNTTFDYIPEFAPVVNEPGISNTRGTIAMAKLGGDPNSATSQWFINLADNSANLDAQNGGFTVFGRVLGDGMQIADDIAALTRYNASNYASAWTDLPLTAAYLSRDTFVETSAARLAPLSFIVAHDDPDLVSLSLTDGVLIIHTASGNGGHTVVRITATDLEGATFQTSVPVYVSPTRIILSDLAQTYDGQPRVPAVTTSPPGLPVTFRYGESGSATPPVTVGSHRFSATIIDPDTSVPVTTHGTLLVTRGPQSTTISPLPDSLPVNAPALTLAATATSGLPVTFSVEGPATLGADGVTLSLTGETGLVLIHADQAGDANHHPSARATHTLTVVKRVQTITFPALDEPASNTLPLAATSDAGLPVAYTVVSGPAHLAEDGITLVITGAGEIVVTASQSGSASALAAEPVTRTLTVAKASQTLAFTELPPALIDKLTLRDTYPGISFPVAATSSSGLPVLISLNAGVTPSYTNDLFNSATVSLDQVALPAASSLSTLGGIIIDDVTIIGSPPPGPVTSRGNLVFQRRVEGTITLTATQAGDDNHLPAEPVTFTIDVGRVQTITFATPATRTFKASSPAASRTFALSATASSRLPVVFEVVSGPATLAADQRTLTLHDTGTVVLRALQPGNDAYLPATPVVRALLVNGAAQTLAFTAPAATATFTYGDAPIDLAATTNAPGGGGAFPITFAVVKGPATLADDGRTLSFTGAGSVVVRANQLGGAGTSPASLTRTLVVRKKPLLVSGVADWRAVGLANPPLALSYEGFVNGDTEADLAPTRPKPQTSATKSSNAGDYPITFTGGSDANYLFTRGPVENLTLRGLGGTYEALLTAFDTYGSPLGKLTLTIPANAFSYTGTLVLTDEAGSVVLASAVKNPGGTPIVPDANISVATATWVRAATATLPKLRLVLDLSADGTLGGVLERNDQPLAYLMGGRPLYAGRAAPWSGQYTLALGSTQSFEATPRAFPTGVGHAVAAIASGTGVLSLKGSLPDGAALTATAKPTIDGTYLLWANPYGTRLRSFVTERLALQPHPEVARFPNRYLIEPQDGRVLWQKAALPPSTPADKRDKSYRDGFGLLEVRTSLDPWLPPLAAKPAVAAITLADRLGLAANSKTGNAAFGLDYLPPAGAAITEAQIDGLPAALAFTLAGKSVLPTSNPSKFALTFNSATGAFSGSFVLTDTVPVQTNPAVTKDVPRKVSFSGTLRQKLAAETDASVGQGFFLLPALPGAASTEQVSGEIRLTAPDAP